MGNPLFGVDISGIIKDVIGPGVLSATLKKFAPGTRTPGQLTGGINPTSASFPCKGFIDRQADMDLRGTLIDNGSVTIVLIGDTISNGTLAPDNGDHVLIEGVTYVIDVVDRDPAAATYTMKAIPV